MAGIYGYVRLLEQNSLMFLLFLSEGRATTITNGGKQRITLVFWLYEKLLLLG